jgi:hypothetical protein
MRWASLLLQLNNTMALPMNALSTGVANPAIILANIILAPALPQQAGNALSSGEQVAIWKALYGKPVVGLQAASLRQVELYLAFLGTRDGT